MGQEHHPFLCGSALLAASRAPTSQRCGLCRLVPRGWVAEGPQQILCEWAVPWGADGCGVRVVTAVGWGQRKSRTEATDAGRLARVSCQRVVVKTKTKR